MDAYRIIADVYGSQRTVLESESAPQSIGASVPLKVILLFMCTLVYLLVLLLFFLLITKFRILVRRRPPVPAAKLRGHTVAEMDHPLVRAA